MAFVRKVIFAMEPKPDTPYDPGVSARPWRRRSRSGIISHSSRCPQPTMTWLQSGHPGNAAMYSIQKEETGKIDNQRTTGSVGALRLPTFCSKCGENAYPVLLGLIREFWFDSTRPCTCSDCSCWRYWRQ